MHLKIGQSRSTNCKCRILKFWFEYYSSRVITPILLDIRTRIITENRVFFERGQVICRNLLYITLNLLYLRKWYVMTLFWCAYCRLHVQSLWCKVVNICLPDFWSWTQQPSSATWRTCSHTWTPSSRWAWCWNINILLYNLLMFSSTWYILADAKTTRS